MKNVLRSGLALMVIAILFSGCAGTNSITESTDSGTVTYQTFYDNLSPYGTWIDYPNYGNVWDPNTESDFRPYATNGHWASSPEGWAWASDFNWGWAPFHYGRWLYDDMYGWLWIPGYDWSPAWVTWGSVDDFYCWAPLMPGVDVNLQFGSWRPHSIYWNACSRDHIYDRNLSAAIQTHDQVKAVSKRITIINNFNTTKTHNLYYSKGPDVQEVQKYVKPTIDQTSIKEVRKTTEVKHNGNTMQVYRPAVQDPKITVQQHPQKILQPKEFRKAEPTQSKPITTEDQKPVMQRPEQKINIQNLPVHRSNEGPGKNNSGNGKGVGKGRVNN